MRHLIRAKRRNSTRALSRYEELKMFNILFPRV